jgi:hypothetical protein
MREIAFRAWLSAEKKMDMHAHMRGYFGPSCEVPNQQAVLMQWTGLKDAAGKPIFEGDLLTDDDSEPCLHRTGSKI